MSTQRLVTHLVGVTLLLLWGSVLLYFYVSGRLVSYLPPDGIFRPMVLTAAIGLLVLGIFNLATIGADESGCDHECDHDHDHDHTDKCSHDHEHDHHDHSHECAHTHDQGCCDHDHGHDHGHTHEHHDHAHGILDESGPIGRTFAIVVLSVPLLLAAAMTPDRFSVNAIENKGVYTSNYQATPTSDQFSLRKDDKPGAKPAVPAPPVAAKPAAAPSITTLPPAVVGGDRVPGSSAPPTASIATTTMPAPATTTPATAAKSYGTFTLADLKAQVPQSKEGNFILEVPEIYYTAGDKEVQGVLTGQPVETTAQVMPEKVNNADGKRLRVFRLLVQCCAADARPYSVPVEFADKAPAIKDMTWVKLVGTMSYKLEGGQTVPLIAVKEIKETTAPENAMLY
jgi:hypothetical protein